MKSFRQFIVEAKSGADYLKKHNINDVGDLISHVLISHVANHHHLKKYYHAGHDYDSIAATIPHDILKKHTGITKRHLDKLDKQTADYEGSVGHNNGNVELWSGD